MLPPERPRPEEDDRRNDAAFVLAGFGVLLLLPPLLNLFTREGLIFGLPLAVVYLFGVWGVLVLGAMTLSQWAGRPGGGDSGPK